MAKETQVAQATNYRGIFLTTQHLSFKNTIQGFEKLQRWMEGLQQKHRLMDIIIGMEPTGHYWYSLANWLAEKGLHVVLVNSATATDPMNELEFWGTNSVRMENRITRWLDIRFPEYATVFKDWTCPRSIATLKEFPSPLDLRGQSTSEVITGWRKYMKRAGGFTGIQKAAELLSRAVQSVGETVALYEAKQDLNRLLEEYERIDGILNQIAQEIAALLGEIPIASQLRSIVHFPVHSR